MKIVFDSEQDAVSVEEQLYNAKRLDNILFIQNADSRAIDLAISLAQIKPVTFNASLKCPLPFPRNERECTDENTPKIYVACLSAYNNAYLHGLYIDATQEPEEILDDVKWMLSWSPMADIKPCDKWAIHDYECWEGIKLSEYEDIEKVSELAQLLTEHGKAYAVYYQHYDSDATEEDFQDRYLGEYEDEEDFVHQMWKDNGTIQKLEKLNISTFYIDWKAVARDCFINSYFSVEVGYKETYVFSCY